MNARIYNVLFLCTGNSARSILAEATLNHLGGNRFKAYSAGSQPKGAAHPLALDLLRKLNLSTEGLRSKSWDEFATPDAPRMDFVFTVCDNAAGEVCPVWPGVPVTAHWGIDDPATAEGTGRQRMDAFHTAFRELERRIRLFLSLRLDSVDRLQLKQQLEALRQQQP